MTLLRENTDIVNSNGAVRQTWHCDNQSVPREDGNTQPISLMSPMGIYKHIWNTEWRLQ